MTADHFFRRGLRPLLVFLFFFSLTSFSKSDELQPLLEFKSALQKSNPNVFSSWTPGNSTCSFSGIVCNSNGFVTEINLPQQNLSGVLPFDSICKLQVLEKLSLGFNFLHGGISEDLKNCTSLQQLDLGMNSFSGEVPDLSSLGKLKLLSLNTSGFSGQFPWRSLENLTSLTFLSLGDIVFEESPFPVEVLKLEKLYWLYLSNCSLGGRIPEGLGNLTLLENLELSCNQFSGEIPGDIVKLKNLWQLELFNNFLTGTLPVGFGNLTSLVNFDASGNSLQGNISEMRLLKNIASLQLYDNQFTGEIPEELGEFNKLVSFSIFGNKFTGPLPQKLGSGANFVFIDASDNFLTGPIPPDMCKNGKMTYLLLIQNGFTGGIPENYANCSSLRRLRVSNNSLSGLVPAGIWRLSNLSAIDLAMNNFEGTVPKTWAMGSSLLMIALSENQFQGQLPRSMANCTMLKYLDIGNFSSRLSVLQLQSNNFHGTIPKTWAKGSNLRMIDLSENQFQGELPRSMANCMKLEYLNVGNNQINDTFPFWLGALSQLKVLVVRSNVFQGAIKSPQINYTFPELHIIDLSQNNFSGILPTKYFQHWNAMKVVGAKKLKYMGLDLVPFTITLANKGTMLKYEKIPDVFRVIDFSSNRFEGQIPELVGSLKGLHSLNLSNNVLTSHIPPSLSNLTNLESMDLSQNKLFGEIPVQLAQLFSLEYFNVSNNCLTGPIPRGNQLDTFQNNSFGGNLGLCGSPLSKKCGDFKYTPTPPYPFEENQSLKSPFEFGWKVVAIGYGCRFVIGVVIGQIVIARKYGWFVKIFGKM
ncbi:receptor-like protein kinase 7 isoform X1 [Corylus avellana]|uniref:receptor-like protein kinase 7 isoform X1 n=1 Tax=Corylus avellana TaxID=13451 RepID=UPI00286D0E3D|nr:receptor-like protein kinase 7 isoform X1 [Corylus avellana]